MRIKKDHQREMLWSFIKFSQLILQGNVSRLVWRISVPDPDLEIRGEGGGWSSRPLDKGSMGTWSPKKIFSAL